MPVVEYKVNGDDKFGIDSDIYQIIKPIGMEVYGVVCSAKHLPSGENVEIRKFTKLFDDLVDGKRILRMVALLQHFNHENICSIKDICFIENPRTFNDLYIVSDLMETDLRSIIRSQQELSREHLQYFTYQILNGLKYIHSAQVIHRGLKPSNIHVNGNCDVKIYDFGLARGFKQNGADLDLDHVMNRWYRSPELLMQTTCYDEAIDIWSVGCILAELITKKPLFPGRDLLEQVRLITDVLGKPSKEDRVHINHTEARNYLDKLPNKPPQNLKLLLPKANEDEIDLITKMLQFNPTKRITVSKALQHPYFQEIHEATEENTSSKPFAFEYEDEELDESNLRKEFVRNIISFHPTKADNFKKFFSKIDNHDKEGLT